MKTGNCLRCNTPFETNKPNQLYCCLKCKGRHKSAKWYAKHIGISQPSEKECSYCGTIFLAKQKNSKFCCRLCKVREQLQKIK